MRRLRFESQPLTEVAYRAIFQRERDEEEISAECGQRLCVEFPEALVEAVGDQEPRTMPSPPFYRTSDTGLAFYVSNHHMTVRWSPQYGHPYPHYEEIKRILERVHELLGHPKVKEVGATYTSSVPSNVSRYFSVEGVASTILETNDVELTFYPEQGGYRYLFVNHEADRTDVLTEAAAQVPDGANFVEIFESKVRVELTQYFNSILTDEARRLWKQQDIDHDQH